MTDPVDTGAQPFWTVALRDLQAQLDADDRGLTTAVAQARRVTYGDTCCTASVGALPRSST